MGLRFRKLVHADWSMRPAGRWAARAVRGEGGGWRADGPEHVIDVQNFVAGLVEGGPTLAGFDFPIGLPATYGVRTGFADFRAALDGLGRQEPWRRFFDVAARPEDIGLHRPFYPDRPGGALRQHLLDGHGVAGLGSLTRLCERRAAGFKEASSAFWTLGANQVGKAMLTGWREVVAPAVAAGAAVWPFDGDLATLADRADLTLAESYPADAVRRLGIAFGPRESKRRQGDRMARAAPLLGWAAAAGIALSDRLHQAVRDGFGPEDKGGDRFDAVVGLFAMIADVDAPHPPEAPDLEAVRQWEGWILGRPAP